MLNQMPPVRKQQSSDRHWMAGAPDAPDPVAFPLVNVQPCFSR